MNKVIYIKAHFLATGKEVNIEVPTGEKKKRLFGGEKDVMKKEKQWQQTGLSDCEIDAERLATDIANEITEMNTQGYEVVSVTPLTTGKYNYAYKEGKGGGGIGGTNQVLHPISGAFGYGYGYSYTAGVTIIFRKIT